MSIILNENNISLRVGAKAPTKWYVGMQQIYNAKNLTIFGWHVDPSVSDPAQAVTYLADARNKESASLYRQVEYLKSTGTQIIVTDIIPTLTERYELDLKFTSSEGQGNKIFFGAIQLRNGAVYTRFICNWGKNNPDSGIGCYLFSDGAFTTLPTNVKINRNTLSLFGQSSIYGTTALEIASATYPTDINLPLALFGIIDGETIQDVSPYSDSEMILYSFKVFNGNELRYNMIPTERTSDGELGLFDTITGKFYANAGTGTFEKGPYVDNHVFGYGDWKDAFFMPKPCMLKSDGTVDYYLDPEDYTLKEQETKVQVTPLQGLWYGNVGDLIGVCNDPNDSSVNINVRRYYTSRCYLSSPIIVTANAAVTIDCTLQGANVIVRVYSSDTVETLTEVGLPYTYKNNSSSEKKLAITLANSSGSTCLPSDFGVITIAMKEPSDVANSSYDGNAMMEWPLIWYKFEAGNAEGEGYFYCSNKQVDDSYKCWCNYDCDDNIIDHFYTAIYNGTGTSKLRSISGVALTNTNGNGGTTVAQEVTRATANNKTSKAEWYIDTWADRALINALLILISRNLHCQVIFGSGLIDGNNARALKEAYITGALNDKGLFWGDTSAGTSGVKVFGMENWWGCAWRRTAGLIGTSDGYAYKLTYGTMDGSAANGYNTTASGYKTVAGRPSANDYITKMQFGNHGMLPYAGQGTASTYWCDYVVTGTGYAMCGGATYLTAGCGTNAFDLSGGPTVNAWNVTAAISCKPVKI